MRRFSLFTLVLLLLTVTAPAGADDKTGRLTGRWVGKEQGPLAGGLAYLFNAASGPAPSYDRYWRIPDEIATVDGDGRFTAHLIPGKYYLGLIKRVKGKGIGPPVDGDYFFFSADEKGKPRLYSVAKKKTTRIGVISRAEPFALQRVENPTAIEGQVTDLDGKPLPGMLVFAFLTPAMVGRPSYVSDRTGADGKYQLRVAEGGAFYLKVREDYGGGQPIVGEMVGGYGDQAPTPVSVKSSRITQGINLKAVRFLGRGPKRDKKFKPQDPFAQ